MRERREEPPPAHRDRDRQHPADHDRRHGADECGGDARLEGAELVRGADEDHLDRVHASPELIRGDEGQDRLPEDDAHHVGGASRREREQRQPHRLGEAEDDDRHAVEGDHSEQRPPGVAAHRPTASARSPQQTPRPQVRRGGGRGPPDRRGARPSRRPGAGRPHRRRGRRRGRARSRRTGPGCGGQPHAPENAREIGRRAAGCLAPGAQQQTPRRRRTSRERRRSRVDELGVQREQEAAESRADDHGRLRTTERCASARTRIARGTSDGVSAREAGAPSADATPVPKASTKKGQVASAPARVTTSRPSMTAMSTRGRERRAACGAGSDRPGARRAAPGAAAG